MNSILLIDSEAAPAAALRRSLKAFGFDVDVAESAKAAQDRLLLSQFDLILVDFDLSPRPSGDEQVDPSKSAHGEWSGTGLIRKLRAAQVTSPILVHTVLEGELYETASLDAGADDFIVKKAPLSVLLSRLHAHLRRRQRDLGLASASERRISVGRLVLDRETRVLMADERPIVLATKEVKLLAKIASSPSRVFSPNEILASVWGHNMRGSIPALSGLLRRLRAKMAKSGVPDPVENVRGKGFRLSPAIQVSALAHRLATRSTSGQS